MFEFSLGEKRVWVQTFGEADSLPVIYCFAGDELREQMSEIEALIAPAVARGICRPFALTAYSPVDWNRDFTPWPAPALSPKAESFAGDGAATLQWAQSTWLPEVQHRIPADSAARCLLGYSLGGLCALWMVHQCDAFSGCACCSGSLWYDGWADYMESHGIARPGSRVYLSLGKKKRNGREIPGWRRWETPQGIPTPGCKRTPMWRKPCWNGTTETTFMISRGAWQKRSCG